MTTLQERLGRGDVIILDGGIGTELERRGVAMDGAAWCATAIKSDPGVVRAVHEDYIRAGAEIITANTFSTQRHVLEAAGMGADTAEINRLAVTLAKQARDAVAEGPVWIAGSVSTFSPGAQYANLPDLERARANYREQAGILAEAGVDVIVMEMMVDVDHGEIAVAAAAETGLPVWVGFSCALADDGKTMNMFTTRRDVPPFAEAIGPVLAGGGAVAGVMHSSVSDTGPALDILKAQWQGPLMAYAESGDFVMPNWQWVDIVSPDHYAAAAEGWVAGGVQIVGGCCGLGPEHIERLRERLPRSLASGARGA